VVNAREESLQRVLDAGCWSDVARFGVRGDTPGFRARGERHAFDVLKAGVLVGRVEWNLLGEHNQLNALAAIAAAEHVGVSPQAACEALSQFANVKRRLELQRRSARHHGV
jgi:UDP-N-acetylmuramate: L-alanyl-gamma-D-glutamyl-meso-diaminopimelate ligase